jgi:hypothetical protein
MKQDDVDVVVDVEQVETMLVSSNTAADEKAIVQVAVIVTTMTISDFGFLIRIIPVEKMIW